MILTIVAIVLLFNRPELWFISLALMILGLKR